MTIEKEVFHLYPEIDREYGLSTAWKVDDTIYMSGITALNENGEVVGVDDMGKQFRRIYTRIRQVLEHFGATLENIVEQTVFVTDISRVGEGIAVIKELWGANEYPPAVGVEVKRLASPEMLVEIKVTARV
ncbi:MAG: RidA family protein [Deltaproteobacteria bacterium]|nr:RidA family protein [Deltaproteobacteria bacterium]